MTPLKFKLFLIQLTTVAFMGCDANETFEKDCSQCDKVNQHEVEITLGSFVYNNRTQNLSKDAINQLSEHLTTLQHGHKFMACGCVNDKLTYQLWCSNDETFHLEVALNESGNFEIVGIEIAEFDHP